MALYLSLRRVRPGRLAAPFLALALVACAGAPETPPKTPAEAPKTGATADESGFATDSGRRAVTAQREMVAAANPIAAAAGLAVLRKGGNALDAAIAVQAMLTLVEPQSSGIGGGGFLMHFNGKSGEISAYEGRETAPSATTENDFMDGIGQALARDRYRVGGISAAVPGALRMLEAAHKRHGKLAWAELFRPTIELARAGFKVSERLHKSIADDRYVGTYPAARRYLYGTDGKPLPVGHLLKNPALADTLEAVAQRGADAFHKGTIARDIAAAVQSDKLRPGKMTERDVAAYEAKKRRQLCGPYRTWLVCGFGPPTAGGITTLMTLALLERFDLSKLKPNSPEAVHLFAEAMRIANADRLRFIADPDFEDVPISGMLDLRYLNRRSQMIKPNSAIRHVSPGKVPGTSKRAALTAPGDDAEQPSTTHFNIIDKDGNAVAMTSSVGDAFGSRLFVRGFFINNHATDFTAVPRTSSGRPKANRAQGNKRPRSAQSPVLVFDGSGRLVMAVGSPGGTRIIAYVLKTIIGVLDWKMDIQAAIALPNRTVRGDTVELERGTELEKIRDDLRALGHDVRMRNLTSGLQGITIEGGVLHGGADPRREGVAIGD
jgi:gamma-glutamyltranspeptidase/glutathione hydrolase